MAIRLYKTPYDMNSYNVIAATTLQTKKISQSVVGIGPVSCWAGVSYYLNGEQQIATGFSQMKNGLVGVSPYKNQWVKYHGELAALAQAIYNMNEAGFDSGLFPITGVYIEMSPCDKCMPNVVGMLPDGTDVYYSFDYATESGDWSKAAKALCKN